MNVEDRPTTYPNMPGLNVPSASILDQPIDEPRWPAERQRNASVTSQDSGRSIEAQPIRKTSLPGYRTRSVGGPFGAGVVFERVVTNDEPPNEDEVIIVTVRVSNSFRKLSIGEGGDGIELPERPRQRSFLRRMSTRWHGPIDEVKYKAIKMLRRDYKKWFARDRDGNYVGSEPERQWDEQDLASEFGRYQDLPLRSILC